MKPHKWAKEIKAWADGAEIEMSSTRIPDGGWITDKNPDWDSRYCQYRIKPQPKEPQYLYVYKDYGELCLLEDKIEKPVENIIYIGKIKLEQDE